MENPGGAIRANFEHVLMCLICRNLFDDYDHQPKFLPCHHTFCKECLGEYIQQIGDEIECPSCRTIASIPAAGVAALQTNFYIKHIQALVSGRDGSSDSSMQCIIPGHQQASFVYCNGCQTAICSRCIASQNTVSSSTESQQQQKTSLSTQDSMSVLSDAVPSIECPHKSTRPLATTTEESHQLLHTTFHKATTKLEQKRARLKSLLKSLADDKDEALKKIDSSFEQHVHTLHRRATLLKNNAIDIFSENIQKIENDLMEVSTAVTCIVSLKEHQENRIGQGDFKDFKKSIKEIDEVTENIEKRIRPSDNHINFEDGHGVEKFQMSVKDLGRVKSVRPMQPRAEPDGKDGTHDTVSTATCIKPKTTFKKIGEHLVGASKKIEVKMDPKSDNTVIHTEVIPEPSNHTDDKHDVIIRKPSLDQPKRGPIINPSIQKEESSQANKMLKMTLQKTGSTTIGLKSKTGNANCNLVKSETIKRQSSIPQTSGKPKPITRQARSASLKK